MSIHPVAVVSPAAKIGADVRIGPFCVVEPNTTIGDRCIIEAHCVVKSGTIMGPDNHVFEGAVVGGPPQHAEMPQNPGSLVIGAGNTIRENVTIHQALHAGEATVVGNHNFLMAGAHVAHDCRVGNRTIITNNVMLAGHVTIGHRSYLSGGVAVHQFTRIGTLAMVGGQAHIVRDVPPFVTVDGLSSLVVGLNQIGLKRAGFDRETVRRLKDAYRVVYRSGLAWQDLLERLQTGFAEEPAVEFFRFLSTTARGILLERRPPPRATLKLRRQEDEELRTKVG